MVVGANAAWASGCYAADPEAALDTVLRAAGPPGRRAAGPRSRLAPRDLPFVRRAG
ncbi:hypothetical protein SNOUR_34940 [Streptomyces noursei ATCC 11455]|nr:hypothetical protein SNOUR_34940 [Streptomyces noursei ATCC 11455]